MCIRDRVSTPYMEPSKACIGCGACAFVCPTGHIFMQDQDGVRTIWKRRFEMAACEKCGNHFAPVFQLEHISKISGVPMEKLKLCQDCK